MRPPICAAERGQAEASLDTSEDDSPGNHEAEGRSSGPGIDASGKGRNGDAWHGGRSIGVRTSLRMESVYL